MKYLDLTHTFTDQMPVYPGDAEARLTHTLTFARDGYNVSAISSGMHVGTHMDSPYHMLRQGKTLDEFPVETFVGRGVLLDARGLPQITAELLSQKEIQPQDIVLVWTGFSSHLHEADFYTGYPALTPDFAEKAAALGVKMVGMDTPSPDYEPFAVHKTLFRHNILIIEALTNLEALADQPDFEVIALPIKSASDGALARVIAKIND